MSVGRNVREAKYPCGENVVRRYVRGAECPWGDLSMGRVFLEAKCPWGEISWGEMSTGRVVIPSLVLCPCKPERRDM